MNIAKTEGLKVNFSAPLLSKGMEIKWSDSIQILGLTFYNSRYTGDRYLDDLDKFISKMRDRCAMWNKRRVSLKGKVIILNVLIYPNIYYASSNLFFPERFFNTVKELSRNFLWNGHLSKISLDTLTLPIQQGGLGLHDFARRIRASRLAWVKRACLSSHEPWTDFICDRARVDNVIDLFLRKNRNAPGSLSAFYLSLYKEWQSVFNLIPNTDMACRSEPIWCNRNIYLRSLARLEDEWRGWGIRRVNDILHMGRIMSVREFRNAHGFFTQQSTLEKFEKYIGREILGPLTRLSML